jgi:hypothetical protein
MLVMLLLRDPSFLAFSLTESFNHNYYIKISFADLKKYMGSSCVRVEFSVEAGSRRQYILNLHVPIIVVNIDG